MVFEIFDFDLIVQIKQGLKNKRPTLVPVFVAPNGLHDLESNYYGLPKRVRKPPF